MSHDAPLHPENGLAPSLPDARWAEAAAHLARRDRGATPAEEADFARWLAEDAPRREAADHLSRVWIALDALRDPTANLAAPPSPAARQTAAPVSRPIFRPWMAMAAGVTLMFGVAAHLLLRPARPEIVATAVGSISTSILPDGTRARLNTDSELAVDFARDERRVRLLRGEACFEVVHDAARPFTVEADGVRVRVVGTVFNLRLRDDRVELVVAEGRVAVDTDASDATDLAMVSAGQRAELAPGLPENTGGVRISSLDTDGLARALAWREGRIVFSGTPLSEALAEFSRHHAVRLELADAELGGLLLGGAFEAADLDGFLDLLETGFGVRVERLAADRARLSRAER